MTQTPRFSKQEIIGGNYTIALYFEKEKEKFRLMMRRNSTCEYIEIEEQNDDTCLFSACKERNVDEYNKLSPALNNVLIEMLELTNNLMNSL